MRNRVLSELRYWAGWAVVALLLYTASTTTATWIDRQYTEARFSTPAARCPIGIKNVWTMEHEDQC